MVEAMLQKELITGLIKLLHYRLCNLLIAHVVLGVSHLCCIDTRQVYYSVRRLCLLFDCKHEASNSDGPANKQPIPACLVGRLCGIPSTITSYEESSRDCAGTFYQRLCVLCRNRKRASRVVVKEALTLEGAVTVMEMATVI